MADSPTNDGFAPSTVTSQESEIQSPPQNLLGILSRLGPGLIIAGAIVGSGELIATTKTGAQAGILLLWLIIIGCVIKVFVQVELGRYTITHAETTLTALDQVPGPRLKANWIIWMWLFMMVVGFGQLGGIVGGVGQAVAIALPIRGDYLAAVQRPTQQELERYIVHADDLAGDGTVLAQFTADKRERILRGHENMSQRLAALQPVHGDLVSRVRSGEVFVDPQTWDDKVWAIAATILTMGLLYRGRYAMVQNLSILLVVIFTVITVGNVVALQTTEQWHISSHALMSGLMFRFPDAGEGVNPLATALATFGIIGVGATELFSYPYWCLEKGYAKFTGPRTDDPAWAERARGWLRVMYYDAFCSMGVYTVATLAFFLMGVAVLYHEGLDPDGMRMVTTLAQAYVPVFGEYAKWMFLIGAFAVLYSTFLIATASNARMWTDCCKVFGLVPRDNPSVHDRMIRLFSLALPVVCLGIFVSGVNPVRAILLAGAIQALLLPVLGVGAIYFRYTRTDPRLRPSRLWDIALILSFLGLSVAGVWGAWPDFIAPLLRFVGVPV